jgi:murein DD-endopeptidase MepM/ murein hydrolase activator NlpD
MRRGVWFLGIGVVLAALGAASAYAADTTTTTTTTITTTTSTTTTTATTTTGTTTTTPAPPAYSPLAPSYLPSGCVGAGAAAIAVPGRHVLMLGTPATGRGPSAYPTTAPIVRFLSSAASGSGCTGSRVALGSASLFGGAVTARSVVATHGRGSVSGVAVYGSPIALGAGRTVRVGGWGEVTAQKTVGRLTAPLVVQLLAAHHGLPAGTTIAFAFSASAEAAHKSKPKHHSGAGQQGGKQSGGGGSSSQQGAKAPKHRHRKAAVAQPLTAVPGLGYKPSHYVFPIDSGASYVDTYGAGRNDIYDGWHHGDDLFAPLGTPVVAVARGTLSLVGWNSLGGWRVWLTDKKGNSFYYAHLAGYARWILTHPNVRAGQVLGFLGRTGDAFTTPPHVHFEVHPRQPAFVGLGYDGAVDPTTYLQKWKVEHVPANEIPQPAKLRAPVGAPRQEAAVVWHQLLRARNLLGFKTPKSAAAPVVVHRPFPHPPSYEASGAPLPLASMRPASTHVSPPETNMPLLVGGPLGGLLALLAAAAGALTLRRRRRTAADAAPAPDPSS